MNRSGVAVERLLARTAATPGTWWWWWTTWRCELGRLRVRERGSHGGHNGLRSLIEVLGTDEFPRVRVGDPQGRAAATTWRTTCSRTFPQEDVLVVQEMVGRAADAVECVMSARARPRR